MSTNNIQCVLFDLDGTLVETAEDLSYALNQLLIAEGRAPLDYADLRSYASAGARGLLKQGFDLEIDDPSYGPMRERFLSVYEQHLTRSCRLFDGMQETLASLAEYQIAWGVVTNKPGYLTLPIMAALQFPSAPSCVIGGDATSNPKPHPDNLLLACQKSGHAPASCLFVGDAERDIVAGRRAGMPTVAVSYGYIEQGQSPADWGADYLIHHPQQLLNCLTLQEHS